jgi:hypothetical protein
VDESAIKILLDSLERSRSSLDSWLHFWTWLVVIGVALEVVFVIWEYIEDWRDYEDLEDFKRGIIHPSEKPSVRLLLLALFGSALIAIGVTGELRIGAKISSVETQIRKANDDRALLFSKEAGDAKTSAKESASAASNAKAEADAVKTEADALVTRLAVASKQLSAIEQDTLSQGPRWRVLDRGRTEFIKSLKPFVGQKSTILICGQTDTERFSFETLLINLLREAGWASPGYQPWHECPMSITGGNEIYFVSASAIRTQWAVPYGCRGSSSVPTTEEVANAGRALCDALIKLRISTSAFMEAPIQSPQTKEQEIARANMFFAGGAPSSPAALALEEPTTIFILVGPHAPMFENRQKRIPK